MDSFKNPNQDYYVRLTSTANATMNLNGTNVTTYTPAEIFKDQMTFDFNASFSADILLGLDAAVCVWVMLSTNQIYVVVWHVLCVGIPVSGCALQLAQYHVRVLQLANQIWSLCGKCWGTGFPAPGCVPQFSHQHQLLQCTVATPP